MPNLETAELTLEQRGILATSASAAFLDHFSRADSLLVTEFQPVLVPRRREYYSRGQMYTVEWRDHGQPLPPWFDPLMQGLVDLLSLSPNWDSYGAGKVDPKLIDDAMSFVNAILGPTSPAPRVVPLSGGGLQFEWHQKGIDLEVVFDQGESPFFYYRNRLNGEESEQALPEGARLLRSILNSLG
jgi:hypothetical protein